MVRLQQNTILIFALLPSIPSDFGDTNFRICTPPMISGMGGEGQLGHGDGHLNHILSTFTKVVGLEGHSISQVSCGDLHTVVLTFDGCVYTFGSNEEGQLGHPMESQRTPQKVTGCLESEKVVFVASNAYYTACITEDGDTFTWGDGEHGQLGHGDNKNQSSPKIVAGLAGKHAKQVACGESHTIVCTEDGRVYSFGDAAHGQLGHGNSETALTPILIQQAQLEGKCVVQVACGSVHSMALTSDGRLYTWGNGEDGRLGHGSELSTCVPSIVESLMDYKVINIACNHEHSAALVDSKRSSYAKKMKAMIDNETCSDVVFLLKDGERIHANKGILIGQSEYFQAMFRSGMKESIENEVVVGDCSKGVFLLLLEYLYKGEVDIGMKDAKDLYVLSDRYQEDGLSSQCLEVIEGGLTNTNAIDLLAATDGAGLDALKDICMEHVVANLKSIKKEGVDSLSRSLMVELLKSV